MTKLQARKPPPALPAARYGGVLFWERRVAPKTAPRGRFREGFMRRILSPIALVVCCALTRCDCGGKTTITVTISPKTVTVDQGASQSFTVAVTGPSNAAVNWTVTESGGG